MDIKEENLKKIVEEVEILTSQTLIEIVGKKNMLSSLERLRKGIRFCSMAGLIDFDAANLVIEYLIDQSVEVEFYGTWKTFDAEERAKRGLTF